MLGKLMKYEFRGLRRPFLILLIIFAATTLVSCLLMMYTGSLHTASDITPAILIMTSFMLYYLGIIILCLGVLLSYTIRFYKTCYTDAGYLTHTLPVSARQLVAAKTLPAIVMQLLTNVFVLISLFFYLGVFASAARISLGDFDISQLNLQFAQELGISLVDYCLWLTVYCFVGCITGSCITLGCVSLGQLYTKHRVLGALIAYFLVNMLLQVIALIGMIPMYTEVFRAELAGETPLLFPMMKPLFIIVGIASVIIAAFMCLANVYMMTKKLNLE